MTRFYIRTAGSDARYQEAVARERQRLREQRDDEPGPLWKALQRWAYKGAAVAVTREMATEALSGSATTSWRA